MRIEYTSKLGMSRANEKQLELVNSILEEYMADGYTLTLRQLYYQLVSRNIMTNTKGKTIKVQKAYQKKDTFYVSALNKQNAAKKIWKILSKIPELKNNLVIPK